MPDMAQVVALGEKLSDDRAMVRWVRAPSTTCASSSPGVRAANIASSALAASMNGYTSTTASITLESGLKGVRAALAGALGLFVDLKVQADAPRHLSASGLPIALCGRSHGGLVDVAPAAGHPITAPSPLSSGKRTA